jgi:hypothetical protein
MAISRVEIGEMKHDGVELRRNGAAAAGILVVVGAPRSGTTLVATALAAHPAVSMLMEDGDGAVFRLIGGKLPAVKLCTPNQIDLDHRRHWTYRLVGWNGWLRKRIGHRPPLSRLSLREMAARATLIVVAVLRDPAANLEAISRRSGRNERAGRDILRRTYDVYERLPKELGIEPHFVSFDRLVRDPEAGLRRLCERLGLPFSAAMLDAPRLNPVYPEATFRADRATAPGAASHQQEDGGLAALRARYEGFLNSAL